MHLCYWSIKGASHNGCCSLQYFRVSKRSSILCGRGELYVMYTIVLLQYGMVVFTVWEASTGVYMQCVWGQHWPWWGQIQVETRQQRSKKVNCIGNLHMYLHHNHSFDDVSSE